MATEKKQINVPSHTLENSLPIDPEKSLLPIQLTGDRVLVEPVITADDEFLSKEANIKKPVNAEEKFLKGRLMCIGGGEYGQTMPLNMKVNLLVNYWHSHAIDFVIEGKKYHLIRASDAFAYL